MHRQGAITAARGLQLGVHRSFTSAAIIRAAAATAPSESPSLPDVDSTSRAATPTLDPPAIAKRSYPRRTAVPASSAARLGTAKSASTSASPASSISAAGSKARTARAAPARPTKLASASDAVDDVAVEAMAEEDHSMQAFSGIDDYAHLAPPSSPPPTLPPSTAAARAPRRAVPPRATLTEQPTPSPPMTSLPAGVSTLPMIGGQAGMPIPATLLPSSSTSPADTAPAVRQPDISGEVSAPAGSDWSTSFYGLSQQPFSKEVAEALLRPLEPDDVELKPDGLLYLPEIKYRRTLNAAFGPGGWGLAPRGETNVGPRIVSREWGLVCLGRLVSVARGEQEYFDPSGIPTATEACKSNALMRCCKDLGIASELWDPRFIREYKAKYCEEVFTEHIAKKTKRKQWRKKGTKFEYPWKET